MLHFTHAVDYYTFLYNNFYNDAPYFKDYKKEGKLENVDYSYPTLEEYINYDADCFDFDETGQIYHHEFIPPVHHVIEDFELLKYLIHDLMNKTLTPQLEILQMRIEAAYQENKPRKIKHELRLLAEITEETIYEMEYIQELGVNQKIDHPHYDRIVDNYELTIETMKDTYETIINDWRIKIQMDYPTTNPIVA